jgi:uncharacterized protein
MTWKTGKEVLNWYLRDASEDTKTVSLTFFGGEPLLEFTLIQQMVEYGNELAYKLNKKIEFGATTNGSLFTEKVAKFWKEHKLSLLLSVDGAPITQNSQRITKNGKDSSKLIEKAFPLIRDAVSDCVVRLTVTPENADLLVENLEYLYERGFRSFAHYPVEEGWNKQTLLVLDRAYRNSANWYLQKLLSGVRIFMGLYTLIARRIIEWNKMTPEQRAAPDAPCGAGKGYLGIGVDGTIYPCHRFVSLDNFAGRFQLGHIQKGIEHRTRNQFVRITNHSMLGCHTVCDHCLVNPICRGGCLVQNLMTTSEMLMPMPAQQFISTMYFEISSDILRVIEENNPKLMSVFLNGYSIDEDKKDNLLVASC